MKRPTKVLCKRTLTNGDTYWWDNSGLTPIKHDRDNRMLVKGDWYYVIYNVWGPFRADLRCDGGRARHGID